MALADAYKQWILDQAKSLRAGDRPPKTAREADRKGDRIRAAIRRSERAAFPDKIDDRCPLDPQALGVLERDGYKAEKLIFQTRPGVYATATCYVPTTGKAPYPAVLGVHGHWAGARRDPVVQRRCIGLAKHGFVCLTLDAWGAGERGTTAGQNEYHGGLLGASLWPVSTPLHGLQLWDNVRALDYLQSRPDVDGTKLGCTGASGGGNQTTYLSAYDQRIQCAVPVCSVGTFKSYLNAACCVDEVLLEGLTYAEEGDLLGSIAPRALMVVTATRDVYHFGPVDSAEALERARAYFQAHGASEKVKHAIFESGHDYNAEMRSAMYGWMSKWLKGVGDGSPLPDPEIKTEELEAIRCFEPASRPPKVMTTVAWVRSRAIRLAAETRTPALASEWPKYRRHMQNDLQHALGLDEPVEVPPFPIRDVVSIQPPDGGAAKPAVVVLLHPGGRKAAQETAIAKALRAAGIATAAIELRGCGELTLPNQGLGADIPDHNLVEWSLWIGRPLLGQWVDDVRRTLTTGLTGVDLTRVALLGWREGGLAALLASALDRTGSVRGAASVEGLASFIGDSRPHQQRMVVFNPDLMKAGDLPQIAAVSAPRPVLIANPVLLNGMGAAAPEVDKTYGWPRALYKRIGEEKAFDARAGLADAEVAAAVAGWLK